MRLHLPAAALAVLIFSAPAAVAQEAVETGPGAPTSDFFDVVEVEIVNIDVFVTDREGRPVTGLTRGDFVVKTDGQEVAVTNFYAVEDRQERGVDGAPAARGQRLALAPEHRLWLIVLVDDFNIMPLHRKRVMPQIRQFLGGLLDREGGDQAMVVTFDRSLKVRQPFTTDASLLSAALDEIEDDSGWAVVRWRERTDTLQRIADARSASQALGYARTYADSQMSDVVATTRALQQLIDSLAGLPGRKALLYVTSGVPLLAGEEMFLAVAEQGDGSAAYGEIPRYDTSRDFLRVSQQATANRVVLYTMDAGGLRGIVFGGAEFGAAIPPGVRSTLESVVIENEQSSLRLLAGETGGQAILNRNEILPALGEMANDFETFYALGIANPSPDEGRFHKIEVEVKAKDVRVRHRMGYRSQSLESRLVDSVRSALLYEHTANPLGVSAVWGRPEPQSDGNRYILPVQIKVPVANVVLLPAPDDRYEMRLALYCGVADERGNVSEIAGLPLGLRIAAKDLEAARGESFLYTHRLLIEQGRQKVALALFDRFANQSSILSRRITAGENQQP